MELVLKDGTAFEAVKAAVAQDAEWSKVPLAERKDRVAKALEGIREQRDTIAQFLSWEIGKPWKLSCADVDRAIEGVEWYLEEIDRQMQGRNNGRAAASSLTTMAKRHILEQEGLNSWGIWNYSQWDDLAAHLTKGFEYAKQRCTAYPRYVVQRQLFPEFLEMYLSVVKSLRFGHPLAVENADDDYPDLHFGPVIQAQKAADLERAFAEAIDRGGVPLYRGSLADGRFIAGQDTAAYVAPKAILNPPTSWSIHHSEPFGPLDSVVLVDSEAELIANMNVSNGNLVSSVATDDLGFAEREGPLYGNFASGSLFPENI